jgi:hypothetical protein
VIRGKVGVAGGGQDPDQRLVAEPARRHHIPRHWPHPHELDNPWPKPVQLVSTLGCGQVRPVHGAGQPAEQRFRVGEAVLVGRSFVVRHEGVLCTYDASMPLAARGILDVGRPRSQRRRRT